jgi:hypothetical protein
MSEKRNARLRIAAVAAALPLLFKHEGRVQTVAFTHAVS